MRPAARPAHAEHPRCTYHPCANFDLPVPVTATFVCPHGLSCPLPPFVEPQPPQPAPPRPWRATVGLTATLAAISYAALRPVPPPPPQTIPHDYGREVDELVTFARDILQKTRAIMMFNEQLAQTTSGFSTTERQQWTSAAAEKTRERLALCTTMMTKLASVSLLDRESVDRALARRAAAPADDLDRRSVGLARRQLDAFRETGHVKTPDLVANAEQSMGGAP